MLHFADVQRQSHSSSTPTSAGAVEPAGTQIVQKALRIMSLEDEAQASPSSPLFKFDSSSFFGKGVGAFTGVGRLVEDLATTLDTVIVQAFEDWGTPKSAGEQGGRRQHYSEFRHESSRVESSSRQAAPASEEWGDFDAASSPEKEPVQRNTSIRSGQGDKRISSKSGERCLK